MSNWNPGPPPPPGGYGPPPGGYGPPPGGYGPPPGGYGPPAGGYGAPPAGGYGVPGGFGVQPPQFLQSPVDYPVRGSFALGFLAGFFGTCVGYVLVLALAKGPETKRGAGIGFAIAFVLSLGVRLLNH